MSLVLRHPENVAAMREHMLANVEEDRAFPDRARWRYPDDSPATVRDVLNQLGTEDGISRVVLQTLARSIESQKIGAALMNTQWGTLEAPYATQAMLTSDRPLIWVNGTSHPKFHLLLPIGPKTLFYAVRPGSDMDRRLQVVGGRALAEFMNEHVTRRAIRYVYGLGDHALAYVQARMGVDPQFTLIDQLLEKQRVRDSLRRLAARRRMQNRAVRPPRGKPAR